MALFGAGGNIAYGHIDRVYQLQGGCCGRHSVPLQPMETSLRQLGTGYPKTDVEIKLRCRESGCPECGLQMVRVGKVSKMALTATTFNIACGNTTRLSSA